MELKNYIKEVPDFPKKGVNFKDITPLLENREAFAFVINQLKQEAAGADLVVCPESRGFLLGAPVAYSLGGGLVLARKPGKLPREVESEEYELEYNSTKLEVHRDSIKQGDKVVIIDDVLATGGTALAAAKLVERLGGKVEKILFLIELEFLKGREKLASYTVHSLVKY